MADRNTIINDLNQALDDLDQKINGAVNTLNTQFITGLTNSVNKARDLTKAFEEGQEIEKKLASERRKINNSIDSSLRLEAKLQDKIVKANIIGNYTKAASLQTQLDSLVAQREINEELDYNLLQLEKANGLERQITEEKKKQNDARSVAKKLYDDNFKKTIETFTTLEGITKLILEASLLFNRISTDISKNFGTVTNDSDKLTYNLLNVAQNSNNVNVTLKSAGEAMSQLSEQTGFVAEYSAETLKTQIMLTKQFGLTAEEASGIYKFSVLTGKSTEQVNKSMVGAYVAARNQLGVGIPFRATMAEAAKVSGQLAANLKNNPEFIVKAVAQAKALGTTLEQTKKQGESLLEFESSIEAELKAELLTGQALNLERARAAALMGDQVTVMKELNNQGMTLEKFQNMNVLAQRSFASAIGLSADELANQLRQQKLAVESGKSLAQITEEEALEAQKRQTIQDKFNAGIDKLKDIVGNLLTGPVSQLLDAITNVVYLVGLIGKPFAYINDLIDKFVGKAGLASGILKTIVGILGIMAIRAAIFSAIMNPITAIAGLAIAGIAATAAKSLIPEMAEGGVVPATPGGKIVKVAEAGQAEAIIPLNKLNSVIAPKQDNTALIAAINRQTDVISSKNYNPTLQTVIAGSVVATATAQNSYNLA